jgi:pilus assembly protein Flp/PilA
MVATLIAAYLPEKEEGQGLVEYALIIVLVSILLVAALTAMKDQIEAVFTDISAALATR